MSIGMTVIIPSAVVLVADSRMTWSFDADKPSADNSKKIHVISDELAVISFGVTQVTNIAVDLLQNQPNLEKSFLVIVINAENSIHVAWESVCKCLDEVADKSHSYMKAALVLGGFSGKQPYLAGILRDL